ncbi:protein O-mannosyl-transferase TMTC1-like [Liolophura sinensis]|uniref:protein O-mannosyl-transferase TMTC1-like n=1 Tax=Liolophura sinensis TaxID=3198878 RepID=UPI0031591E3B
MEPNNNVRTEKKQLKTVDYFKRDGYAAYVLTVTVSVLCFLNSLCGDFVHDDIFAIRKNGDVSQRTSLLSVFSHDFWGTPMSYPTSHKSYRPLTILSFRLNHYLSEFNPVSYHIVNVLLHAAVTGLFTHICLSVICLSVQGAIIAGLLFAVHPIHTEAVSGLVGRADVLSGMFFLLSFLTYAWSANTRLLPGNTLRFSVSRPGLFVGSLLFAVLSMLCKEPGITVLGLNLLYDVVVVNRQVIDRLFLHKRYNTEAAPLLKRLCWIGFTLFVCMGFRLWMMGGELPPFMEQDNPASFSSSFLTRFLTYNYLACFNLKLLLAPITLSYDWTMDSIPLVEGLADTRNILTVSMYLGILFVGCAVSKRREGPIAVGLLFLCVPFVPASNLLFRVGFVVAERLLYIPSMGQCLLVAYGYMSLWRRFPRLQWLMVTMILLTIGSFGSRTLVRNNVWQSRETLFRSGLESVPRNAKVHYNYANYLKDEGYTELAIKFSKKAIELYPSYAVAWNNLGTLMTEATEAERCYTQALRYQPDHIAALINLGSLHFQQGSTQKGLSMLRRAEALDPHDAQMCIMLGSMLAHLGQSSEAGQYFRKAIQEKPDFADAYNNYGSYLQQTGRYQEAIENYRHAFLLDTSHVDAMTNAAQSLRHLGRLAEAESLLKRAVELRQSAVTLDQLGKFYLTTGQVKDALAIYRGIEEKLLNRSDITGLKNYAKVLVETKNLNEADGVLHRVLQVEPEDVTALHQMSNVQGLLQQHTQGLTYIERAIKVATVQGDKHVLSELLFAKASHLKDLKKYEEALLAYLDSLSINNNQPKAHVNAGAIYHMKHELKLAKHHYMETLKLEPSNHIARENLEKLEKLAKKKRVPQPG